MKKKKVNRSVERQRDVQIQDIKTPKDVVGQQQVNKQNITIKIVPESLKAIKKKKKKRKSGPSKKKQIIDQIKIALNRLQELKKDADEKGVKIPAELGTLPQDADQMKTVEQLTGLLNTLNDRNNQIAELITQGGQTAQGNVFAEGVFGSGGTFPRSYRLPSSFQQPAQPIMIGPQGQTVVQPQPPAGQRLPAQPTGKPPDTRTVIPQSKSTRDQEIIMGQIKDIKKELQDKLKVQLKEGKISKKDFADKMAEAQQKATARERETLRTVMGPEANKDYIEIMKVVTAYRKKVRAFKGTKITGEEVNDIKDLGNDGLARIANFKSKYPKLVDAHPEIFAFDAQIQFLGSDPVAVVAEEQGTAVQETGIEKADGEKFNRELFEVNQNAQELQSDFENMKKQGTLSPEQIKELQKQANFIDAKMKELKAKADAGTNQPISLAWQKAENKGIIGKATRTIKAVMNLALPKPVKQVVDMRIQKAIWRLLAYIAGVFPLGAEYDKSTFNADLGKIGFGGFAQDTNFKKMKDNSTSQKSNVGNWVDNYMSTHDGFDRQFEGKDYKIMKSVGGGGQRRMMPTPTAPVQAVGSTNFLGFGARIGSDLPEIPEMAF